MSCNYSNKEKFKNVRNEAIFILFKVVYFEKSKSDVYFYLPETLNNLDQNWYFPDYLEFHN